MEREFEMLVFGDQGYPLIIFPSTMGRYYEPKDRGLIDAVKWFVEQGLIKIYCVDSIDALSWYNTHVLPASRAYNHACYDNLLYHEVLPFIQSDSGHERIAVAGCSFGGYHASNFAFKYPARVSYLFSMSAVYDIKPRVDDHYDDNVYFNNPIDYMPDNEDPDLWRMGIILGSAANDVARQHTEFMSRVLDFKNISHWLDIRQDASHDWPTWKNMLPHYLSLIK
ncbi:alpha/beta hydrolase-fold protein [Chitinophaga caeni]|uniref:alpha/beta hydrolase-fold protein n=1 Tax=Chitinophaga caeni TaxID=2029983 RepID=UPI001E620A6A|nr:alpha/beta hydrolase-fold protein [Chitinophaga caeni]